MHGVSSSPQKACQRKAGASLVIVAHGIPNAVRPPIAALASAATAAATCPTRAFRSFTAAVNGSQLPGVSACRSLALKGKTRSHVSSVGGYVQHRPSAAASSVRSSTPSQEVHIIGMVCS